jgi:hypothetical protein
MNSQTTFHGPHLDDGELVRYIDAEGTGDETRRWDQHLDACEQCWREAETLRGRSRAISRWLAAADFEATGTTSLAAGTPTATAAPTRGPGARGRPDVTWSSPWLKAAVITLLLAAPLAALPPVRGWVAEQLALVLADGPAVTHTMDTPAALDVEAGVIRFVPAPGSFRVVIDASQAEGSLRVDRASGPEAVLEVRGTGPRPEPVISARTLRIANTEEATASYVLSLPEGVDGVWVEIGGHQIQLGARDLARSATVPLRQ